MFRKIMRTALASAALLISATALLGYLLEKQHFYQWGQGMVPMARNTALAILALSLGMLLDSLSFKRRKED
jgi:ascorbate-specific PTS system EIIC-type component UlaA